MKNRQLQFGDVIEITRDCLVVIGRDSDPFHEPSCGTVLLYKFLDTLYIIDTGATIEFREKLLNAIHKLKPFNNIIIINTLGNPSHVSNNIVIEELHAQTKTIYISKQEFESLKNPQERIAQDLKQASNFMDIGNSPAQTAHKIIEQYRPIDSLSDQATVLDSKSVKNIYFGHISYKGWELANGHINIIESHGYSPGSIMIYIAPLKLLFSSDETFSFFPPWPSSNTSKYLENLQHIRHMLNDHFIERLIGSRHEQVFTERAGSLNFIDELLSLHARFDDYLRKNLTGRLADGEGGATIQELYLSLEASPFVTNMPHWQTLGKMIILNKLKEMGCKFNSTDGPNTRFRLP